MNEVRPAARSEGRVASDERRETERDWLEIATTVLLSIAAVFIAWGAYQSELWGGIQDTRNTESIRLLVDATDAYSAADVVQSLDQLLFVDLTREEDEAYRDLLFSQMSEPGQIATDRWLENDEIRPFDDADYIDEIYFDANELHDESFVMFGRGLEANENGDEYQRWATLMALVLFIAGVSLVLDMPKLRVAMIVASSAVLVWAAISMVGLPTA